MGGGGGGGMGGGGGGTVDGGGMGGGTGGGTGCPTRKVAEHGRAGVYRSHNKIGSDTGSQRPATGPICQTALARSLTLLDQRLQSALLIQRRPTQVEVMALRRTSAGSGTLSVIWALGAQAWRGRRAKRPA